MRPWSGPAASISYRLLAFVVLAQCATLPPARCSAQGAPWDSLPRQAPDGGAAPPTWGSSQFSQLPQAAPAKPANTSWTSWLWPSRAAAPAPTPQYMVPNQRVQNPTAQQAVPLGSAASGPVAPATPKSRPWLSAEPWSLSAMPGSAAMKQIAPVQPSQTPGSQPAGIPVSSASAPFHSAPQPAAATVAYNGYGLPGTPVAHWQTGQVDNVAPQPVVQPSLVAEPLGAVAGGEDEYAADDLAWSWQMLPTSLIYHPYLAGVKEPRLAAVLNGEAQRGTVLDLGIGARVGLLRYGTSDVFFPEGWQLDIEGAAFPRLDPEENMDMEATDFKFGVPVTWGWGRYQMKFAYSHLSSHLGDEYAIRNGLGGRINFSRDALVWGHSYYPTDALRIYGEIGYAFVSDVSEPWDVQLGVEYSPICKHDGRGAPFVAVNGHLRQEVDFGGNFVFQAGWQWTSPATAHRVRIGVQYYNGHEEQYEFFSANEQKVGVGLWYDF